MSFNSILILTDQPIEFDYRVKSIEKLFDNACLVEYMVIDKNRTFKSNFISIITIICSILFIPFSILKLKKISIVDNVEKKNIFLGIKAHFKEVSIALNNYFIIREKVKDFDLVYSNDQKCGIITLLLFIFNNKKYIYDEHEVVPYRARKQGFIRKNLEFILEYFIIKYALKTYVVNKKIEEIYKILYSSSKIETRNNDFYKSNYFLDKSFEKKAILYIGAVNQYRGIQDLLNLFGNSQEVEIVLCISNDEKSINIDFSKYNNIELVEFKVYEEYLAKHYFNYMFYMWMAFDNSIFSYKISLPNKFFQSIAFGIPMIVKKDSYLADIVKQYNLGFILEEVLDNEKIWDKNLYLNSYTNCINFDSRKNLLFI